MRRHVDEVFAYIIAPAAAKCGFRAIRSDHLMRPGRISEQMFQEILEDEFCIAVLTGHNPNVYYELAIAHAIRRPVIILAAKGTELPFDVKDVRCVYYDLWPSEIINGRYLSELVGQIEDVKASNGVAPPISVGFAQALRRLDQHKAFRLFKIIGVNDEEPAKSELYQSFKFDVRKNRNPVANLWADPQPENSIKATLQQRDGIPVLRITFESKGEYSPNVGVHPEGLVARIPGSCSHLSFKAAIVDGTGKQDRNIAIGVRVVNGAAEHWQYVSHTGDLSQFLVGPMLATHYVNLSPNGGWKPFGGAGAPVTGGEPNFGEVSSVIFHFGTATGGRDLGPGSGVVDLGEIGFCVPEKEVDA